MAYTLVQSKAGKGNSGTSVSVTGLTPTTAGNLLVMIVDGEKNPGDVTFTPPAGWVQIGATQHQDIFIAISGTAFYYPNNPGGITSVAVTASSSLSAWHCYFLEFSGVATSSPLDAQSVRTQQATTTPSSGNITTTQSGDLIIGWISEDDVNGAYTLTQPGGWTTLARNQDGGAWASLYVAYKTAGSAGTESYAPTLSSTATDNVIGVAAFLTASAGGVSIAGEADGVGAATLSLTVSHALTGESDSVGTATLSLTVSHNLVGEADGVGAATLALTVTRAMAGTAAGVGTASLSPTIAHLLIGESDGIGAATLSLTVTRGIVGESDGVGGASLALTISHLLSGEADGVGVATLSLAGSGAAIVGQTNGVGAASLNLTVSHLLTGATNGAGAATLALIVTRAITGEADGAGSAALVLLVTHLIVVRADGAGLATLLLTIATLGNRLHGTTVVRASTDARGATVVRPSTDADGATTTRATLSGSTAIRGG